MTLNQRVLVTPSCRWQSCVAVWLIYLTTLTFLFLLNAPLCREVR